MIDVAPRSVRAHHFPDEQAEHHRYRRIVDESGEDYGYAAERFFAIEVPKPLQKALLRAAS